MAVKHLKPTSAGRRFQTVSDFAEITCTTPEKSLLEPLPKKAGRNNNGRITTRHQGGGHKRQYRKIDFKRRKDDVPAKVATIEYDPNRSARIALLQRIFKVDLAILVVAIIELKYIKENPKEVIVNEAVNLAKKYSTDKSPKFINGVLADIIKGEK